MKPLLKPEQAQKLEQTLAASRMNYQQENDEANAEKSPVRIQEIDLQTDRQQEKEAQAKEAQERADQSVNKGEVDDYLYAVLLFALLLMLVGFIRARRL